ncbi:MAG: NF038122 family metalloprotease [Mariniblastus sp.]
MNRLFLIFAFAAIAVVAPPVSNIHAVQLTFNTNTLGIEHADQAIKFATDQWANEYNDDITINLHFSFANLGGGTLSQALSAQEKATYSDFWTALGNDRTTNDDISMHSSLPTGTSFSVYINRTNEATGQWGETPYLDNDGGANNTNVQMTTANAKALGLRAANDSLTDASIVFNTSYVWDFDRSDGIASDAFDFIGIAMHEIGHAMGFESGVDILDGALGNFNSDDDYEVVSPLDFLRFSGDSESAGADLDFTADSRSKYFSIDGGLTVAAGGTHWSTGVAYGDGEQASHWRDGYGIMEPTSMAGEMHDISSLDIQAFDVIGYDRGFTGVPEPSTMIGLVFLGTSCLLRRRRPA